MRQQKQLTVGCCFHVSQRRVCLDEWRKKGSVTRRLQAQKHNTLLVTVTPRHSISCKATLFLRRLDLFSFQYESHTGACFTIFFFLFSFKVLKLFIFSFLLLFWDVNLVVSKSLENYFLWLLSVFWFMTWENRTHLHIIDIEQVEVRFSFIYE